MENSSRFDEGVSFVKIYHVGKRPISPASRLSLCSVCKGGRNSPLVPGEGECWFVQFLAARGMDSPL